MGLIPYVKATKRLTGSGHPTLPDTLNVALQAALVGMGYDPNADTSTWSTPAGLATAAQSAAIAAAHGYTDTQLSGTISPADVQLAINPQDGSVRGSVIEYPVLSGEVGVVDVRYKWGNVQRFGAVAGVDATTVLTNVFTSAQACGIRHVDFAGMVLTHANPIVASITQHLTINAFGASIQYTGTGYAWDVSLPTATASPRWTWFGGDFFDGNSGANANGCFKFTDAGGMKFFRTRVINFRRAWRMHNNLRWSENNAWYGCQVSAASTVGAEDPTKLGHAIEFSVETVGVTSPSFARTNVIDIQLSGGVSGGHYFYGNTGANVYDSEFHSINGNIPASTDPALKTALFYFDGNCRGSSISGVRTEFNGAGAYGYYLFDKGPNCTKYPAILEFETGGGLTDWFVPGFDLTALQKVASPGGFSGLALDKAAPVAGTLTYNFDPKVDFVVWLTGPSTANLPATASVVPGRVYAVFRAAASTGNVILHPATGEKINGSTSDYTLTVANQCAWVVSFGNGSWLVIADSAAPPIRTTAPLTLAAGGIIDPTLADQIRISGTASSGGVTTDTTTPIANGYDGQLLMLIGGTDADPVTIPNETAGGTNIRIRGGAFTLRLNYVLWVVFSSLSSKWLEVARSPEIFTPVTFSASHSLVIADHNVQLRFVLSGSTARTVTLDSTLPAGFQCTLSRFDAAAATLTLSGSGCTINTPTALAQSTYVLPVNKSIRLAHAGSGQYDIIAAT